MEPRRKDPDRPAARRPYRKPTLVDYGAISARTLSSMQAGSKFDVMLAKLSKVL